MIDLSNINFKSSDVAISYSSIVNSQPKSEDIDIVWLGIQDYNPVLSLQREIHKNLYKGKGKDVILMLEHRHVYTLGRNADKNHILPMQNKCNDIANTDRGGDVTYHGPGQLVCYPIINLNNYNKSVSWYVSLIQDCIIDMLKKHKIIASKKDSRLVGIWVDDEKIAAIGIRLSRWVSMHGFAINVNTDLSYFDGIIPCGIFDYGVTSMEKITNNKFNIQSLANQVGIMLVDRLKGAAVS